MFCIIVNDMCIVVSLLKRVKCNVIFGLNFALECLKLIRGKHVVYSGKKFDNELVFHKADTVVP